MDIPISEAKGKLTDLVRRAEAGDDVVLTRHGRPAAKLVAVHPVPVDRRERSAIIERIVRQARTKISPALTLPAAGLSLRSGDRAARVIVADTSALLAVLFEEPDAARCKRALETEPDVHISAGTLAEALIILAHRGGAKLLLALVEGLGIIVDPVTATFAERVGEAHGHWGRGAHAAKLNFGDCFAYALTKELDCPLLFIGDDFARTDVQSALS